MFEQVLTKAKATFYNSLTWENNRNYCLAIVNALWGSKSVEFYLHRIPSSRRKGWYKERKADSEKWKDRDDELVHTVIYLCKKRMSFSLMLKLILSISIAFSKLMWSSKLFPLSQSLYLCSFLCPHETGLDFTLIRASLGCQRRSTLFVLPSGCRINQDRLVSRWKPWLEGERVSMMRWNWKKNLKRVIGISGKSMNCYEAFCKKPDIGEQRTYWK